MKYFFCSSSGLASYLDRSYLIFFSCNKTPCSFYSTAYLISSFFSYFGESIYDSSKLNSGFIVEFGVEFGVEFLDCLSSSSVGSMNILIFLYF